MLNAEDLWQRELSFRNRLRGRSLIMEAEIDHEEALSTFVELAHLYFIQDDAESRRRVLRKYRALLITGLVTVGSLYYEDGAFWRFVDQAVGREFGQTNRHEVTKAWNESLNDLDLARFETPMKYVGEILIHGGIPASSVATYIDALNKVDGLLPNLQPGQFIHIIGTLSAEEAYHVHNLTRPTWRFLTESGEISADFVSRTLLVVDQLRDEPNSDDSCGLPEKTFEQIRTHLSRPENKARLTIKRGKKRRLNLSPTMVFDENKGVRILLPPLEETSDSNINWRVDIDGESKNFYAKAPFPGEQAKANYWNIVKPSRRIVLTATPGNHSWTLPLIDPDDPLIVFDGDSGSFISSNSRIPKGRVWFGYPLGNDVNPIDQELEIDGPIRLISNEITFYGWEGWAFRQVDLSKVTKFRLSSDAMADLNIEGESRWRLVSSTEKARLEGINPVPYVQAEGARQVTSSRPYLVIPGFGKIGESQSLSDNQILGPQWRVSLSSTPNSPLTKSWTVNSTTEDLILPLWAEDSLPVFGVFNIEVSGPLGKGFQERFAVLEGIEVSGSHECRKLLSSGLGLEEANLRVHFASLESSYDFFLDSQTTQTDLAIPELSGLMQLSASLPYMSVTLRKGKEVSTSITPSICEFETIQQQKLIINFPFGKSFARLISLYGEELEQDVIETSRTETQLVFDLSQLADSLAGYQSSEIYLETDFTRTLVGLVQPRRIAKNVFLTADGKLRIQARSGISNLEAAIYPTFAPWKKPLIVNFDNSLESSTLPEEFVKSGNATVALKIQNPWLPEEWPVAPPRDEFNSFNVEMLPLSSSDGDEYAIQNWLAGLSGFPQQIAVDFLINIYVQLLNDSVLERLPPGNYLSEIATHIAQSGLEFVSAINDSEISSAAFISLLVESGLSAEISEQRSIPVSMWDRKPTLALLFKAGFEQEDFGYTTSRKTAFGAVVEIIMAGDEDPFASVGSFKTPLAEALDQMNPERLDEVMAAARAIPGRLLDKDERMIHARELFNARHSPSLSELSNQSHKVLRLISDCVEKELGEMGSFPIQARSSEPGWLSLPAVSIALALINRLAARHNRRAIELANILRPHYTNLTKAAPSFVNQDLVLAELWLSGWEETNESN